MPSFLSRILGRKKAQGLESPTDNPGYPAPLLDGKFEAISPNVSPSAAFFADPGAAQIRGDGNPKDKESPFSFFRAKSRASSDLPVVEKPPPDVPHLSLHLPITKDRRALDVVFESDPQAFSLLNEAAIRERRLTPHEALSLVRACSQVIIERGLETLGVMHPHWHSTSPEVQHRLVSLYLLSLTSTNPDGATSPTSPTAATTFDSELHYSRSTHDVAAVLRWALRHLKLEGDSFGKESGDWTWYNTFAKAERAASYPPDAFSNSLIPQLPTTHTELLLSTLDIISSLSAQSEANGSSGSKLSKFFGLWLLTSDNSTECDDWSAFYDQWDRAGRVLEHLFLARIRNDAHNLPRRLTDLVEYYPYDYGLDAPKDDLLPRPRFSTRQYDALFVRVDTEYTGSVKPKPHPLRLIADALRAQHKSESSTAEDDRLWDAIKKASFAFDTSEGTNDTVPTEPIPIFSNIFSDETIRLFSLIPGDVPDKDKSASIYALRSPISPNSRSFSLPETPFLVQADRERPPLSSHALVAPGLSANNSTAPPTASPETPADWLQFSSRGFGTIPETQDLVATLWDDDVEKTVPPPAPLSRKSSRRAHSRHSSLDSPRTPVQQPPTTLAHPISKAMLIRKVKLDEAFIDFWADSLLDPSPRRWPRFVLCQLKPHSLAAASDSPAPAWLVIEQRFVRPAPVSPVQEVVEATVPPARPRPSSPRPSSRPESSRLSAAFSIVSKKRFPLFTGGSGDPKSPKEKENRLPQVGELGEGLSGTGEGTAVRKPEETEAKDGVDGGAALVVKAVDATAPATVNVSAAAVAAAGDEPVGASAPKADEPVKDEPPHGAPSQNGLVNDEQHGEEQRELEPKMPTPQDLVGDDVVVIPPVTNEPVETETEPVVSRVEAETTQPESVPYVAGIGEGTITQAEVTPIEHEFVCLEPVAVPDLSAPAVEETLPAEEKDTIPTVPLADPPVSEEPKSAGAPAAEPTLVPAESTLVQAPVPIAAAIEEPLESATLHVAEPEPAVEAKSTAQDLPADEPSRDTELTRTLEEVPAPVAEPVLVSETPDGTSPEVVPGDSPSELASLPAPLPVSELPAPEEDISAEGGAQVAVSADLPPIVIEDLSATEPEHVTTASAVPAIQTSSIDEGQALDSVDAVETTAPLEEPAAASEPALEEDAQLIAIPEKDDAFPDEPDMKPATAPAPVVDETTLPVPNQADSAAAQTVPEAPVPTAESDVEHEVFVTQAPEESLPSQATPKVQNPVIDEQPLAEETTPTPEASASESIPTGDPATSTVDASDAAPPESAVAEDAPATELVPGGSPALSENLPQEVLEEPVTEPVLEPATAIAHDSTHSYTNGSAEPEILGPADEPSVPMPEISATVTEEPVPPAEADILVETPAPAAQETHAIAEEATPVADAETLEATAPEVAETIVEAEAPGSVPVESDDVPEEAAPAATDAFVVDPVSATEELTPAIEDTVPAHDHALAEQPVSVPEEPTPLLEETASTATEAPADPVPVPEESVPVPDAAVPATESPADPVPMQEEVVPVADAAAPAIEVSTDSALIPEEVPITDAVAPANIEAPADSPSVEEPSPKTEAVAPATEIAPPEQSTPDLGEAPAPDEPVPVLEEDESAVPEPAAETPVPDEPNPTLEEDQPVVPEPAAETPALDEPVPVLEEDEPVAPEPAAETPVPDEPILALEEDQPVVPEPAAETPASDEPVLVLEEDEPVAPEPTVETPAPDEPAPVLEEDEPAVPEPPAETPAPDEPIPVLEEDEPAVPEPTAETPAPDEPAPVFEEDEPAVPGPPAENLASDEPGPGPILEEDEPAVPEPPDENPASDESEFIFEDDEPAVPEPPAENPAPLPEDLASATESAAPTTDETPAETAEDGAVELPSTEPAAETPASAADEHPSGLEGVTVEAEPAVEEPVLVDEQVAQELAALSSSEAPAIAAQEPPSVEAIAAPEPEAPPRSLDISEANGTADAGREHEVEELADEAA